MFTCRVVDSVILEVQSVLNGKFLKTFSMSAMPLLYEKIVDLVEILVNLRLLRLLHLPCSCSSKSDVIGFDILLERCRFYQKGKGDISASRYL